MSGLKFVFIIGFLTIVSCDAFWWGRNDNSNANQVSQSQPISPPTIPPALRQYPISYIRAFAYHPVAFPQPLQPITTYHVRNQQSPGRSFPQGANSQQNVQNPSSQEFGLQPSTSPSTTTTTTTTTTTPAPPSTTQQSSFSASQPIQIPQSYSRGDFNQNIQRQLPQQQQSTAYQNFGGNPYYYNQQFHYRYDDAATNQFAGRFYNGEPSYQQYSSIDPITYQFIPTSITPITQQNSVKFVPCMCPVAVQVSPPLVEKRADEIPILSATTESNAPLVQQTQPSIQEEIEEESK
jgi:hypothetical protein